MAGTTDGEAVDIEIYEALRHGDPDAAVERLFRQYGTRVYRLCCRLLKDRAAAEDVMQETFMKAYDTIDSLDEPSKLGAWVVQIARNRCFDQLRKEGRLRDRLEALSHLDRSGPTTPAAALERSQTEQALRDCIAALPEEKREAVLLRFHAALEYAELAASLGENPDTVRIRVARTLPELRRCLEKKGVTS